MYIVLLFELLCALHFPFLLLFVYCCFFHSRHFSHPLIQLSQNKRNFFFHFFRLFDSHSRALRKSNDIMENGSAHSFSFLRPQKAQAKLFATFPPRFLSFSLCVFARSLLFAPKLSKQFFLRPFVHLANGNRKFVFLLCFFRKRQKNHVMVSCLCALIEPTIEM